MLVDAAAGPARVLEFVAGSGAMSLRLADLGFQVTASDLFPESFKPSNVPFVAADLNGAFAVQWPQGFDAVMALEIVEHLENPRDVLRQIRALLPAGGQLVLSTPNIANPVSQALFLRRGQFQWFRDIDYREQGHVTPLSPWMLERALLEAGFAIRTEHAISNPFSRIRRLGWGLRLLAPRRGVAGSRRSDLNGLRAGAHGVRFSGGRPQVNLPRLAGTAQFNYRRPAPHHRLQCPKALRIKRCAHHSAPDVQGLLHRGGSMVRAFGADRIEDVGDGDHSGFKRNLRRTQPARIAAAIEAFVVRSGHPRQFRERWHPGKDLLAV